MFGWWLGLVKKLDLGYGLGLGKSWLYKNKRLTVYKTRQKTLKYGAKTRQ